MALSSKVQTVTRATDVLDLFSLERQDLGTMDVSRLLGIPKSNAHRLLSTLESSGYLKQNEQTQRYQLGYKILRLAGILQASIHYLDIAQPFMQQLRAITGETISIYVAVHGSKICVHRLEGQQEIRIVVEIGIPMPLYQGASGKLLLSYLPFHERQHLLNLWHGQPDHAHSYFIDRPLDAIEEECSKIRKRGYSVSRGERIDFAASLAAPIFDHQGAVLGALTISGPSMRFSDENVAGWIPQLTSATGVISQQLGYINTVELS